MASFLRNTIESLVTNISNTYATFANSRPNARQRAARAQGYSGGFFYSGRNNHNNNHHHHHHRQTQRESVPNNRPPDNRTGGASNFRFSANPSTRSTTDTNVNQPRNSARTQNHQQQNNQNENNTANMTTTMGPNDRLDIQDVCDPNDINNLSVKQLKIILTRNCIDYKGVFEKEVLRQKVTQLWIEHNEKKSRRRAGATNEDTNRRDSSNRSQDSLDIDDNQLCKICMEREISCVFLECGHYLTCVTCGRKLAECPICRQNIVRCVRTFKG